VEDVLFLQAGGNDVLSCELGSLENLGRKQGRKHWQGRFDHGWPAWPTSLAGKQGKTVVNSHQTSLAVKINLLQFYSLCSKIKDVLVIFGRHVLICFLVCWFIHFAFNLYIKKYLDTCVSKKAITHYTVHTSILSTLQFLANSLLVPVWSGSSRSTSELTLLMLLLSSFMALKLALPV
jgi:hypothetical protein